MHRFFQQYKKTIAAVTACMLITVAMMSFQNTPFGPIDKLDSLTEDQDTIPEKNKGNDENISIKDFNQLMINMEKQGLTMEKEMAKIDFDDMQQEITASLNKVDFDKITSDIDKAIKEIDFDKIEQSVQSALKEIDCSKVNNDIKVSLQDARKEIEKINMSALKNEMQKAKVEIEKSKAEIKKINVDEIMRKTNASITKAKNELRFTKEMFNEMEKDGLIDQKNGFTIEYKNKTLSINGKKQSETIRNKYQRFISGDSFKITISREE